VISENVVALTLERRQWGLEMRIRPDDLIKDAQVVAVGDEAAIPRERNDEV